MGAFKPADWLTFTFMSAFPTRAEFQMMVARRCLRLKQFPHLCQPPPALFPTDHDPPALFDCGRGPGEGVWGRGRTSIRPRTAPPSPCPGPTATSRRTHPVADTPPLPPMAQVARRHVGITGVTWRRRRRPRGHADADPRHGRTSQIGRASCRERVYLAV